MSNPIKHHYISKFYLKYFTKSGGSKQTLFCFDKTKGNYFESNPKDICYIKNFNTITYPGKEYIVEIEQSKMEGVMAKSFDQVIEMQSFPNDEQLTHILSFIALTSLRNPRMRSLFDKFYEDISHNIISMTMSSEEVYISQCIQAGIKEEDILPYKEQKEFTLDKSRYDIKINQEAHIKSELRTMEHLLDILYKRNWYLIVSNETIGEFITSDDPATLTPSVKSLSMNTVGYGMKNTEVCFPISKYLVLIGVFEEYKNINNKMIATKDLVKTINERTYEFARKQVFSTKKLNYSKLD